MSILLMFGNKPACVLIAQCMSVPGPDLDRLTVAELQEYRATVATLAKGYDVMIERSRLFDFELSAILAGIPSGKAMIGHLREVWGVQGRDPEPVP
jgi:hypothetical protein